MAEVDDIVRGLTKASNLVRYYKKRGLDDLGVGEVERLFSAAIVLAEGFPPGPRTDDRPQAVIEYIARVAATVGGQANVGAMETAGSIISYLAEHPEHTADFMAGKTSVMDWPVGWYEQGCLTWQGMNGKIVAPEYARHARIVRSLSTPTDGEKR